MRSGWLQGLLDAENGTPTQPCDWDIDEERDEAYWASYEMGVRDYMDIEPDEWYLTENLK